MKKFSAILLVGSMVGSTMMSCSRQENWTLKGSTLSEGEMVYIEEPTTAGGWYVADSIKPDATGAFVFTRPRAKGSIYRVSAGNLSIYVPADSTETIELTIGQNGAVKLSGSPEAELFSAIDSIIAHTPATTLTRSLLKLLDGNYSSLAAYYATRRVRNRLLLRTVTNRHVEELPDNPRTAILAAEYDRTRNHAPGKQEAQQVVITAPETSYFEIELMDRNGDMQKLSSVVDSADVALLAFVDFTASNAPAVNMELGEAHSRGLAIYQVGFAENQHLWANATESLPWTTVYQSESASRTHLQQYVVSSLPTFFLFRNGEIIERISDPTKIKDKI